MRVQVKPDDVPDRLFVTPVDSRDASAVVRALAQLLPNTRVRRSTSGIIVPSLAAAGLLEVAGELQIDWHREARRIVENRQRTRARHANVIRAVNALKTASMPEVRAAIETRVNTDPLDDHQLRNVAAMTVRDSFGLCVFDEQGAGKTVTFIYAFDVLAARDEADLALILAPKSMVPEWPGDFRRFKGDLYDVGVLAGGRRQKLARMRSGADVLVTNFETAISLEQELTNILVRHGDRAVLVVDESFYIKNVDARRTKAIRRLREWCGRAFVLCGTPAPNSPHDLVQQFTLVDFGLTFGSVSIPEDRGAAVPVVRDAMEQRGAYIRHLKSEVLPDLPSKTFHRVFVKLEPVQAALYRDALDGLITSLRSVDDVEFRRRLASFAAKRMALLQICANPRAVAPDYSEIAAKLWALDGLLETLIGEQGEKVVIWSFFTASIDALLRRYERYGPVRYDGTVADVNERREAVRSFQEDDEHMLFVANPAAAGAGLTLHRARFTVYESMSNQAAHYLQSVDRIHRRGQTRDVEYVVLLCEDTLEVSEYERLTQKEVVARDLLGDAVDEPLTREVMLAEAIDARRLLADG